MKEAGERGRADGARGRGRGLEPPSSSTLAFPPKREELRRKTVKMTTDQCVCVCVYVCVCVCVCVCLCVCMGGWVCESHNCWSHAKFCLLPPSPTLLPQYFGMCNSPRSAGISLKQKNKLSLGFLCSFWW